MIRFLCNYVLEELKDFFRIRRKPRILQMPVTGRCNSRCVTCNVWKVRNNKDIDPIILRKILCSPYFSKVTTIGLNGGELTLVQGIDEIINAILVCKSLKYVHIISNGLLPDKLFTLLKRTKKKLNDNNVKLGFTLSIDGIGKIHEETRGVPGCFSRTKRILDEFQYKLGEYCDSFNIGCTISNSNVEYLAETYEYLSTLPFQSYYHLAVPNKRIHTFSCAPYYVLGDERKKLLAQEFFQSLYLSIPVRKDPFGKFRAFANYYFLKNNGKGRLARCGYRNRDITIDENLDMSYCATASDTFGSLEEKQPSQLISSKEGKAAYSKILNECHSCVHYIDFPTIRGGLLFLKDILTRRYRSGRQYK